MQTPPSFARARSAGARGFQATSGDSYLITSRVNGVSMNKPEFIDWKVDYEKKVITITVRLAFYRRITHDANSIFQFLDQATADRIKKSILQRWSGLYFKCFRIIIDIQARASTGVGDVHKTLLGTADELIVELNHSIGRSQVVGGRSETQTDAYSISDDPSSGPDPTNVAERDLGAQWTYEGEDGTWAHEFGHVLGLGDGYVEGVFRDDGSPSARPGHTRDLMVDHALPVSAEMITRLVRRSGKIDESKIRCPMIFEAGPFSINQLFITLTDLIVKAEAADWAPPSDDPRHQQAIKFSGTVTIKVGYYAGSQFAVFRDLLDGMAAAGGSTGVGLPAEEQSASFPVEFELPPLSPEERLLKHERSHPLVIRFGGDKKLSLEGVWRWNSRTGLPVLQGPMTFGGVSTEFFYPGPPLRGVFRHGEGKSAKPWWPPW
jgi:hypothetical protein